MKLVALAACLLGGVDGLRVPNAAGVPRRELLANLASASLVGAASAVVGLPRAAEAVSARTGLSSVFTGEYDDPNHPGCLRSVKVVGGKTGPDGKVQRPYAQVKGVDGLSGEKSCSAQPSLQDVWSLEGKLSKTEDGVETILIDFSPKGGPKTVAGKYDTFGGVSGIAFPDGNKWVKVEAGTPSRRPPNKTLSSEN